MPNPPNPSIRDKKISLRRELRSVEVFEPNARSIQLCQILIEEIRKISGLRCIALYAAMPDEPDLSSLFDALSDYHVCFPRIDSETLRFHQIRDHRDFVTGKWGIAEPRIETAIVEKIDLMICPGSAFTLDGKRLGKGKGYYDRFLAAATPPPILWGVQFRERILEDIPCESHDMRMQRVFSA